jgi:aromatic-L-amino-acid decarboxylase
MIVATVGTTAAGAVDDLRLIGEIARSNGAWCHVDAAWGGAAGFAPRLRDLLNGISDADSVAWDAHKWLPVPMGAGMFFCRHPDALRRLFDVHPPYVPGATDELDDLYRTSLQWSRRFIGLKVFLTLATLGHEGISARIQRQLELAGYLRACLERAGWIIVNRSPFPIVCFTHLDLADSEAISDVSRAVAASGRAWISAATLPEGYVLRACITHDESTRADIDALCEELAHALSAHSSS